MSSTRREPDPLHVYLFGAFRIEKDGEPIHLPRRKVESLLAYLILHPEPHSREKLAALLWGEFPDADARASLRNALALLRKNLGADILIADADVLQLNPTLSLWVDVREFKGELEGMKDSFVLSRPLFLTLYRGELLTDFYDDWIFPLREHYREMYVNALLALIETRRAQSDYAGALEAAQRLLATDPANERAHQHAMFCYNALGQRQAALEQYDKCVRALREELAVEPSSETVALYQKLKQAAETISSPTPRLTNLPIPLTSFIGRTREIQEVKGLLTKGKGDASSPIRLLTLTGAGGSGKTRLAIKVATDLVNSFRDGVWWVELAGLNDPALVPQMVAKALGVADVPHQSLTETLGQYLGARHVLLVLDNCEHLIDASADLAERLLIMCPDLRIMTTSREPLGIAGEVLWLVPTLAVPDPQVKPQVQSLVANESVRLFVERATAVKSDFQLTDENALTVAQLCQRLDGIPLAIELAAARTRLLTAEQLVARLNDRFNLLTTGSRTALPRQQTLRATIDWSYDLLSEAARQLLRRLSVFAGGFTLVAAERICSDEQLQSNTVLDLLGRLVDQSLVLVEQSANGARYRMLETIREYARDKLAEAGESERLRSRHLDYFIALAETAESDWYGPRRLEWFKRIEREHDNLSAALESSLALSDGLQRGMRLAGVLAHFWAWRTHKAEAAYWLEKFLAASRDPVIGSTVHRAKMLWGAGILAFERAEDLAARQLFQESAALCRALNAQRELGFALLWLGIITRVLGDWKAGRAIVDESVAVLREAGDKWALAYALGHRGAEYPYHGSTPAQRDRASAFRNIEESLSLFKELGDQWTIEIPMEGVCEFKINEGEYKEARALRERCLQIARELGNEFSIAVRLMALGEAYRAEGHFKEAEDLYAEALEVWRKCGNQESANIALGDLATMAIARNNPARAAAMLAERLKLELGPKPWSAAVAFSICQALVNTAAVWVAQSQPSRAARLLGAVESSYERVGNSSYWPYLRNRRSEYGQTVAAVQAQLTDEEFKAFTEQGRSMSLREAAEYALSELNATGF